MRQAAETATWRPNGTHITWLGVSIVLVVAPHMLRLPLWLTVGFLCLAGWTIAAARGYVRKPGRPVRYLATLCAPLLVYFTYGSVVGRDAGVALLVILGACKLIETVTLRDAHVTTYLACFLGITSFLFSQDVLTGAYMLVVVVVILATFLAINDDAHARSPRKALKTAGMLALQAAPLMVVLFLLFPRVPGPLWGLPKDARAGVSKLSNTMSPGRISELSLSNAVAFRVIFESEIPPPSQRYWRGPVLWRTDGRTWTGIDTGIAKPPPFVFRGKPVDYVVTVEPHFERWLFALDMPATVPAQSVLTGDFQLRAAKPLQRLRKYPMRSYPQYATPRQDPAALRAALQLPTGFHPRSRALARQWRDDIATRLGSNATPERIAQGMVDRALEHFRTQPFYYTLRPPILDEDSVDEFMFLTRRGFCEFYAAAFTVMMRAAGVPARVVTGYQGGDFNDIGQYLIVRQRDAHAWAEVWLDSRGWVRVDPTAAVAPERIEMGMDAALPQPIGPDALGLSADGPVGRLLRRLRFSWDTMNNVWNQWVVDYSDVRQQRFLSRLGIDIKDWRSLAGAMLIVGGIAFAVSVWWLARAPRVHDPAHRYYLAFCAKLKRRGLVRAEHEAPSAFAARVLNARPDLEQPVHAITTAYLLLRYAPNGTSGDLETLKSTVSKFRP